MPIPYDVANPDPQAARRIYLDWLRANPTGNLDHQGDRLEAFVEWTGQRRPDVLAFQLSDVFWQLLVEGIVAPGMNASNQELPWYHVTSYGKKVLAAEAGHPHDEEAYLARVRAAIAVPDDTVMAYLVESIRTFRRGTPVAATVMLGIAAERVFLLVCEALLPAIRDAAERGTFESLMERFPMKPKLDWVHNKLQTLQTRRVAGLPENAALAVTAIYDFLRTQRNDLGHPRETPPVVDREEVFVNLQIFPRFYQTADALRQFFGANNV
jgi:hypothetical protein